MAAGRRGDVGFALHSGIALFFFFFLSVYAVCNLLFLGVSDGFGQDVEFVFVDVFCVGDVFFTKQVGVSYSEFPSMGHCGSPGMVFTKVPSVWVLFSDERPDDRDLRCVVELKGGDGGFAAAWP